MGIIKYKLHLPYVDLQGNHIASSSRLDIQEIKINGIVTPFETESVNVTIESHIGTQYYKYKCVDNISIQGIYDIELTVGSNSMMCKFAELPYITDIEFSGFVTEITNFYGMFLGVGNENPKDEDTVDLDLRQLPWSDNADTSSMFINTREYFNVIFPENLKELGSNFVTYSTQKLNFTSINAPTIEDNAFADAYRYGEITYPNNGIGYEAFDFVINDYKWNGGNTDYVKAVFEVRGDTIVVSKNYQYGWNQSYPTAVYIEETGQWYFWAFGRRGERNVFYDSELLITGLNPGIYTLRIFTEYSSITKKRSANFDIGGLEDLYNCSLLSIEFVDCQIPIRVYPNALENLTYLKSITGSGKLFGVHFDHFCSGCSSLEVADFSNFQQVFVEPDGAYFRSDYWSVEYMFANCIGLTVLKLPPDTSDLCDYALTGCNNLSYIDFNSDSIEMCEGGLSDLPRFGTYVPAIKYSKLQRHLDYLLWNKSYDGDITAYYENYSAPTVILSKHPDDIDNLPSMYSINGGEKIPITYVNNQCIIDLSSSAVINFYGVFSESFGAPVAKRCLFKDCVNLTDVRFSRGLDSSNNHMLNLDSMFEHTPRLRSVIGIEEWDTTYVNSMSNIFNGCGCSGVLTSNWKLNNVTNFSRAFANTNFNAYILNSSVSANTAYGMFENSTITKFPNLSGQLGDISYMFNGCSSLKDVSRYSQINGSPNASYAFKDCTSLTDIESFRNKSFNAIDYMFYNCINLSDASPMFNSLNNKNIDYTFYNCKSLTQLDLSAFRLSSLISSNHTFENCTGLTSIVFSTVNNLGDYCFNNCASLSSIDISTVNNLGNYCFNDCADLKKASFRSLTNIGSSCFRDCVSFNELVILNKTIAPTTEVDAFYNVGLNGTLYTFRNVPGYDIDAYPVLYNTYNWNQSYVREETMLIPAEGGVFSVNVPNEEEWEITSGASSSWYTINNRSGEGNISFTIQVDQNLGEERVRTIFVDSFVPYIIILSQEAYQVSFEDNVFTTTNAGGIVQKEITYNLKPDSIDFVYTGIPNGLTVTHTSIQDSSTNITVNYPAIGGIVSFNKTFDIILRYDVGDITFQGQFDQTGSNYVVRPTTFTLPVGLDSTNSFTITSSYPLTHYLAAQGDRLDATFTRISDTEITVETTYPGINVNDTFTENVLLTGDSFVSDIGLPVTAAGLVLTGEFDDSYECDDTTFEYSVSLGSNIEFRSVDVYLRDIVNSVPSDFLITASPTEEPGFKIDIKYPELGGKLNWSADFDVRVVATDGSSRLIEGSKVGQTYDSYITTGDTEIPISGGTYTYTFKTKNPRDFSRYGVITVSNWMEITDTDDGIDGEYYYKSITINVTNNQDRRRIGAITLKSRYTYVSDIPIEITQIGKYWDFPTNPIHFPISGGTHTITYSSLPMITDLVVAGAPSWLTVTPGVNQVQLSASSNRIRDSRIAVLLFTASGFKEIYSVLVEQEGTEIEIINTISKIESPGGVIPMYFSNPTGDVLASDIIVNSSIGRLNFDLNGTLNVEIPRNSGLRRIIEITITIGDYSYTTAITQTAWEVEVHNPVQTIGCPGGVVRMAYSNPTGEILESDIVVTSSIGNLEFNLGNTLDITIPQNTQGNRNIIITITIGWYVYTTDIYQITCDINVDVHRINFPSVGGEAIILVDAETEWRISVTGDWLTVVPLEGIKNGRVYVTSSANMTQAERVGYIYISNGIDVEEIRVVQAPYYPPIRFKEEAIEVSMDGGEIFVTLINEGNWNTEWRIQ